MPASAIQPISESECQARSQTLDQRARWLWLPGRRKKLAEESLSLGHSCCDIDQPELAKIQFQRVQVLFQGRQPSSAKDSLEVFARVASSYNLMGIIDLNAGRLEDAGHQFDHAIELRRKLHQLFPKDRENAVFLGGALCNRAHAVADKSPDEAIRFYKDSLQVLRQPMNHCRCGYWDEQRQSWWCEQLEAWGDVLGPWIPLAPQFIDHAMAGLLSLEAPSLQDQAE